MNNLDDLEKLARLKESGVITEEEFSKKKAEILGTPSLKQDSQVALWNPQDAVNLSVFLSPLLGVIIHAKNWKALGETERYKKSMRWVYFGILTPFILVFTQ